mmetsp:Transcript_29613/g.33215  ORF Transcript_29613/g.33215 Transcript_29613/m.33215 type:complete len:376 (-) Transcript_29613:104-1231(-)
MVLTRRSRQLESDAVANDGEKDQVRSLPSINEKKVEDELPHADDESNNKNKKKGNNKKKLTKKQQKEALKSRNTGVGIRISIESSGPERKAIPSNKKSNFDDTNLPSEDNDHDNDNDQEEKEVDVVNEKDVEENDDDIDAVEEVQGQVAREEVIEQLKTEEKQSLKSKKKRKRKSKEKSNKTIKSIRKSTQKDDEDIDQDDEDDEELDENFFAQLDVVRQEEDKKRKETELMEVRAAAKGKHTTFVFPQNTKENENEGMTSEPVKIDENIQVVVLKNPSTTSTTTTTGVSSSFGTTSTLSKTALIYSRNQLLDGSDSNNANDNRSGGGRKNDSKKRKNNRSGEEIKPWKRAKKQLPLGRSRMKKGGPATFFRKKR